VSNLISFRESRAEVLSLLGTGIEALTTDMVQLSELQGYLRELCVNYEAEISLISTGKLPISEPPVNPSFP
jgi:hypothetical protein